MAVGKCYFIQCGINGPIKIGYAKYSSIARLKSLQVANPEKLYLLGEITGNYKIEKSIHEKFKKNNIRGEWFRATKELLDYIKFKCEMTDPSDVFFPGETHATDPDGNKYYDTEQLSKFLKVSHNAARNLCEQKVIKSIWHLRDYWVSFNDIIFFLHDNEVKPIEAK